MRYEDTIKECLKEIKGQDFLLDRGLVFDGWLDSVEQVELIVMLEQVLGFSANFEKLELSDLDSIENINTFVLHSLGESDD